MHASISILGAAIALAALALPPNAGYGPDPALPPPAFYEGSEFPPRYHGGAFVGQHGSWNRSQRSGYRVIFVEFDHGKPVGEPEEVLSGFVDANRRCARVWRVTYAAH